MINISLQSQLSASICMLHHLLGKKNQKHQNKIKTQWLSESALLFSAHAGSALPGTVRIPLLWIGACAQTLPSPAILGYFLNGAP